MRDPITECPKCHCEVWFDDPLWNQCGTCQRWFSGTGQEVISPEAYSRDPENYESISDIYSEHDPEDVGYGDDGYIWS